MKQTQGSIDFPQILYVNKLLHYLDCCDFYNLGMASATIMPIIENMSEISGDFERDFDQFMDSDTKLPKEALLHMLDREHGMEEAEDTPRMVWIYKILT